jgi:quercetin dioxygenase-like cupin family protein
MKSLSTKSKLLFSLALLAIGISSCDQTAKQAQTPAASEGIFPKGELIDPQHFTGGTGSVYWIQKLDSTTTYDTQIASVTYEKGARTKWHFHPAGQILLITEGTAYYQEKGKAKEILQKGGVAKCPPNVPHWHGASPDGPVRLLAVNPQISKGGVQWLEAVSEEAYKN